MKNKTISAQARIQLKSILFATDFSPAANAALPWAATIARRYGAKVYAVHVCPPSFPPSMASMQAMAPADEWSALAEAAEVRAREKLEALMRELEGIERSVVIGWGDVWPVLAKVVEKDDVDLIVVGTRGRTGLGKLLLGSVAETIFRMASCPVLTVGPHSSDLPRAGEFQHILFATNFNTESLAAAPFAISLAQENQAQLTLLHVVEKPKTGELIIPEELVSFSAHSLEQLISDDVALWCKPESMVEVGEPAETILEIAQRENADLIVLGVHPPKGLPGASTHLPMATAHKVVARACCPVLTVRG